MGRRTPRQTPETAQIVHDREGFLGALRGRTNVPIPVGRDANSLARSRAGGAAASAVRAYQDVFTLTGVVPEGEVGETVELTYLPLTYSEHAYLNGVYQQEGADYDWTRESGTRVITVRAPMDARAGDVLIVEYLYYAGSPIVPVDAIPAPTPAYLEFGAVWKYKTDLPKSTPYYLDSFDDSSWDEGPSGFGFSWPPTYLGTDTGSWGSSPNGLWTRARFSLPEAKTVTMRITQDNDMTIYIDEAQRWNMSTPGGYTFTVTRSLTAGEHLIAVWGRNIGGAALSLVTIDDPNSWPS